MFIHKDIKKVGREGENNLKFFWGQDAPTPCKEEKHDDYELLDINGQKYLSCVCAFIVISFKTLDYQLHIAPFQL